MEREFTQQPTGEVTTLGRKAWTAYIGLCIWGILLLAFIVPISLSLSLTAGLVALLLSIAILVFRFFELRAYHFYCNDAGVWLYSGIVPWNKGVRGVKWRDVDDATFSQGFWTWVSKSHSVRVGHRFTRSSELLISSIGRGDKAAMEINTRLQQLARDNQLR